MPYAMCESLLVPITAHQPVKQWRSDSWRDPDLTLTTTQRLWYQMSNPVLEAASLLVVGAVASASVAGAAVTRAMVLVMHRCCTLCKPLRVLASVVPLVESGRLRVARFVPSRKALSHATATWELLTTRAEAPDRPA